MTAPSRPASANRTGGFLQSRCRGIVLRAGQKSGVGHDLPAGGRQVRAVLEGLAFQLFAERATAEQRDVLVDAFKKLKRSIKDSDPLARLHAKDHFYGQATRPCAKVCGC